MDIRFIKRILPPKGNKIEFFVGLFLLIISLIIYFFIIPSQVTLAKSESSSSLHFPQVTIIFMAMISFVIFIQSIFSAESSEEENSKEYFTLGGFKRIAVGFILIVGSFYGLIALGYLITIFLTILCWMLLFGERNWKPILLVCVVSSVLNYYFFTIVMHVNLPRGIVIEFVLDRFFY